MRVIGGMAGGVPLKGPPNTRTRPTSDKVRGAIFNTLAADVVGARVLDLYAGTGALGIEALSREARACLFVEHARAACNVIKLNLAATRLTAKGCIWCADVAHATALLDRAALTPGPSPSRGEERQVAPPLPPPARAATPPLPSPARAATPPLPRSGRGGGGVRDVPVDSTFLPPYDVIIIDPPYNDAGVIGILERICSSSIVGPRGLVVLEHGKRVMPPTEPGGLAVRRSRTYGDTSVTIWEKQSSPCRAGEARTTEP